MTYSCSHEQREVSLALSDRVPGLAKSSHGGGLGCSTQWGSSFGYQGLPPYTSESPESMTELPSKSKRALPAVIKLTVLKWGDFPGFLSGPHVISGFL